MSSAPTSTTPTPPAPTTPPVKHASREITLISHSPIFYWWPIWVLGYVMALLTLTEGHRLAIVPDGTKVVATEWSDSEKKHPTAYHLEVKGSTKVLEKAVAAETSADHPFKTRVSQKAWMAPVYCVVLLITILITNIPLRGLWSFLVILMMIVLALIISLIPDGWDHLLSLVSGMHIYINMGGYLFIATAVLILWAVSVFIFDQRTYMVISPGQIRVCEHIGASIRNFDTTGLSFEKQRDDLFRHWILGFFSGDLIVRTHGAEKEEIRFPNVLWIGWRLEQVQEILRERTTVVNS